MSAMVTKTVSDETLDKMIDLARKAGGDMTALALEELKAYRAMNREFLQSGLSPDEYGEWLRRLCAQDDM